MNGAELPVVDIITGGSPCQDLSIAGARAGLDGERSGLFREQIRIIKEMREHDRQSGRTGADVRPKWSIWENVPGCFSSNAGRDFQAVLTEFVRVVEPDAPDVPMPPKNKWPHAGLLYDELGRWSIAWRVHNAEHWGVPQRRKRVSVVADFGGLSAGQILFESEGMQRNFNEGGASGQDTSAGTGSCPDRTVGVNRGEEKVIASTVETYMEICENVAPPMKARDYKDPLMILKCPKES